jgi:hypothetical protein
MLNPLKLLRYLVFGECIVFRPNSQTTYPCCPVIFVISNAIITSAAVWNLSIVEDIGDVIARGISIYLIFLGALGLVVIFTVIFSDLCGKDIFIVRVWFELLWVVLFFMMELAGAAAITVRNGQLCNSNTSASSCASTQVLQAFTWICAISLLGYFILIFISAILKCKDDPTIWSCSVRKFFWQQTRKNATAPLPSFRNQVPVIAAPRPRRIITVPEAVLSYRSGLSLDYEIEHYQPPAPEATDLGPSAAGAPLPPLPLLFQPPSKPVSFAPVPASRVVQPPQKTMPAAFAPFYPSYIQTAINPGLPPQVQRLPQGRSPSPPPLGDWPRRDAISLPARGKRKQNPPAPYSFTMPTAQQHHDQLTRPRPSGPRRRSNSGDHRLPNT